MNILLICHEYPPGKNGGIGTMVQVLGREFVKQGHKVYVAGLYSYRYGELDYEVDQGVKVWRLRYGLNLKVNGNSRLYNAVEKLPDFFKRILNGEKAFKAFVNFLKDLIDKEKMDVIEIPDWNNFSFFMGFEVKWPAFKIPLILKSHGSYTYFNSEMKIPLNKKFYDIDVDLFKRADDLVSVSNYTAEENRKLFNITRPVKVLYNSIEIPVLDAVEKRKERTVIFTGSLLEKKGIYQLMKAWNLVTQKKPEAELLVFGKGNTEILMGMLSDEARKKVFFKGHVSREHILSELRSATLAVFPSYSETFGIMSVEAMSNGCPVIYTKRSCGPEIITDKKDGALVDPDNINEIAETIIMLLENKIVRNNYSIEGRKTAIERFNSVNSARQHVAHYSEVIDQFKSFHKN